MTKKQKLNDIALAKENMLRLQNELNDLIAKQEQIIKDVNIAIENIMNEKNMFCGSILTEENLLDLLKVKFANPKENIKIKYNLYFND